MQSKWLRFLREVGHNDRDLSPDLQEDKDIRAALKLLEFAAYTDDEIEIYHIHMDKGRIESTVITDALRKGRAEGLVEGMEKGKAEGLAEGEAKGEMKAKAAIIQALFASGLSAEKISQITQSSLEEVQRILRA
jgi:predicted transposase YdaD